MNHDEPFCAHTLYMRTNKKCFVMVIVGILIIKKNSLIFNIYLSFILFKLFIEYYKSDTIKGEMIAFGNFFRNVMFYFNVDCLTT